MPRGSYIVGDRSTISLPAASGETNTGSSLGGDAAVFKQKSGVDLEFRGLSEGSNITLTQGASAITIASSASGGGFTLVTKSSGDQAFSSATPAADTDLKFTSVANTNYLVRVIAVVSTAGTTTGHGCSITGPAGTYLYWAQQNNSDTAINIDAPSQAAAGELVSGTGSTTERLSLIEGVIQIGGSGGTVQINWRSENTNTITVHTESVLLYSALS